MTAAVVVVVAVVAAVVAAVPVTVARTVAGGAGVAVGLHHSMIMRQSARNDYVILANLGNM